MFPTRRGEQIVLAGNEFIRQRDLVLLLATNPGNLTVPLSLFLQSINALGPGATTGVLAKTAANVAGLVPFSNATFTPTATFATVGDLAVAYASQAGEVFRFGKLVVANVLIQFTPTYTTAAGEFQIAGLPFTIRTRAFAPLAVFNAVAFPAGCTAITAEGKAGGGLVRIVGYGTTVTGAAFSVTQITSTVQRSFAFTLCYLTDDA